VRRPVDQCVHYVLLFDSSIIVCVYICVRQVDLEVFLQLVTLCKAVSVQYSVVIFTVVHSVFSRNFSCQN